MSTVFKLFQNKKPEFAIIGYQQKLGQFSLTRNLCPSQKVKFNANLIEHHQSSGMNLTHLLQNVRAIYFKKMWNHSKFFLQFPQRCPFIKEKMPRCWLALSKTEHQQAWKWYEIQWHYTPLLCEVRHKCTSHIFSTFIKTLPICKMSLSQNQTQPWSLSLNTIM